MKVCVFTLGCKMNEVESASIMRGLEERGFEVCEKICSADLYIINTCAVTKEAERKSRQAVSRMKKCNPSAKIVVLGCAAEEDAAQFFKKQNVSLVLGAQNKDKLFSLLEEEGIFLEDGCSFSALPAPKQTKTRAFLRIQDGCNRFCSYCIIPYLRGRSRSRSKEEILNEAKNTSAKEIVLTGVDLSSYRDKDTDLKGLLKMLSPLSCRIRLGSLEAGVIDEEFLFAMKDAGNVVEHFHLSLQSGSDSVLKAMNRKYTRAGYLKCCEKIYALFPNAAITTDLIVGYPTETEKDFQDSLKMIDEAGFSRVHCFPYSPRPKTRSYFLPDLPSAVKKERMARAEQEAEISRKIYLQKFMGRELKVLFEEDGGYSENYIRIYAKGAKEGDLCRVKLLREEKDGAFAEILEVL